MRQAMMIFKILSIKTFSLKWCRIEEIINRLLERRDLL